MSKAIFARLATANETSISNISEPFFSVSAKIHPSIIKKCCIFATEIAKAQCCTSNKVFMVLIASWGILSGIPLLLYIIYTLFHTLSQPPQTAVSAEKNSALDKKNFVKSKNVCTFASSKLRKNNLMLTQN